MILCFSLSWHNLYVPRLFHFLAARTSRMVCAIRAFCSSDIGPFLIPLPKAPHLFPLLRSLNNSMCFSEGLFPICAKRIFSMISCDIFLPLFQDFLPVFFRLFCFFPFRCCDHLARVSAECLNPKLRLLPILLMRFIS